MFTLLKDYIWIFIVAMVPLIELRAAVPIGIGMGLELVPTYVVAVLGNIVPVPIILLFAKKVLLWCTKLPKVGGVFQKIWEKGVKGGDKLQEKAGNSIYWALLLFVGIPLPGTGAWTGALAATILDLKFVPSFLAIAGGVMLAGVIMGVASTGVFGALGMLF